MRYSIAIVLALLLGFALPSCSENPSSSEGLKGTLTLVTILTDENGIRFTDHSDVTATIDGTTRTGTSDADGFISFPDLAAGTYVITLTKPGFSAIKIFGAQFVGGGTAYIRDVFLTELPTYDITTIAATVDTTASWGLEYVNITGSLSSAAPDANGRLLRVFLDTASDVSSSKFINAGPVQIQAGDREFRRLVELSGLRKAGVAKGTKVYAIAYPASLWTVGYFDPTKRRWVEANLAPQASQRVSFVMP